jgi:hypothetical protein
MEGKELGKGNMVGGDTEDRGTGTDAGAGRSRSSVSRLREELASQGRLLDGVVAQIRASNGRLVALRSSLDRSAEEVRMIRSRVGRLARESTLTAGSIRDGLHERREELDRLRLTVAAQEEQLSLLGESLRDSHTLEKSQRRELARKLRS